MDKQSIGNRARVVWIKPTWSPKPGDLSSMVLLRFNLGLGVFPDVGIGVFPDVGIGGFPDVDESCVVVALLLIASFFVGVLIVVS